MKKLALALCVTAFLSLAPFAQAANNAGCYNPTEFESEQGLRIHSELMVIGLTCAKMPKGQTLYSKYQQFTQKHRSLITQYENNIIDFFRKQGAKNPEQKLHTLRTSLANKISQHAISMSTSSFCQHFGGRIDKALSMDQGNFRRWAQHAWPNTPTSRPTCGNKG